MGAVYEVTHTRLDRRAALKVLRPELARDSQIAARFLQEAKAASKVEHPGVSGSGDPAGFDSRVGAKETEG